MLPGVRLEIQLIVAGRLQGPRLAVELRPLDLGHYAVQVIARNPGAQGQHRHPRRLRILDQIRALARLVDRMIRVRGELGIAPQRIGVTRLARVVVARVLTGELRVIEAPARLGNDLGERHSNTSILSRRRVCGPIQTNPFGLSVR